MSYLNQLRASMPSFSSLSSGSTGYERVSDSEITPLCTPMPNTFDSVFNNQFFEDFSGLVPWQGLTDEQWERHLLTTSKFDCSSETNTLEADNECLYDQTDHEFDAVAAVRAGLMRSRPTYTTQRALEIIDRRSKSELTCDTTEHLMARQTVVVHQEEIEDYTAEFEISDQLEVLTSAGDSSVELSFKRDSVLNTIEEEDENEDGELIHFPSIRLVAPTTPMIDLAVETWEYPSFSTPSTVLSTPDSVSHLLMSPFFSSPAVFQDSIINLGQDFESLYPPISSVQFGSRHPQPTSLLDEDLDVAKLAHLKVAPSIPYSGLRLDGCNLHTSWSHEFAQPSQDDYSPDEDSGDGCGPYILKVPPKDLAYTGLGIYLACTTTATMTAGSNHPAASPAYTTTELEDSKRRVPKAKGLSLRLPSGLKRPLKRHTASLRTSESCQDLASSTAPLLMDEHGLSTPIVEMSSLVCSPTANSSPASFRTFSPRCAMRNRNPGQPPTFRVDYMARRINSVKRTLSFLF